MQEQTIDLIGTTPGTRVQLRVLRFGQPGHGPRATIQAALHADEVPALLVAQQLRRQLQALEAAGQLLGEVCLVPVANPLGLAQQLMGQHQGRFALRDGVNFNRGYSDLAAPAAAALQGRLSDDEATNTQAARAALQAAADALPASDTAQDLKRRLLQLSAASDIVLDLHCDGDALMHLYALTPQRELAVELGALLGAEAVLLATESGDSPFDEACSTPWLKLRERFRDHPIALGCFAATVELRGQRDTEHAWAEQDATALIAFLRRRGVVAGAAAALPAAACEPTPLAGSEPVQAPHAGVLVFHAALGAELQAGQLVCDLVDVDTGTVTPLRTVAGGKLYARSLTRWAEAGQRVAKIAGTSLARTGKLLSP